MEFQLIINWILGLITLLLGFLLKTIWQAVKDLQASDKEIADKINHIEVLVAGNYVTQNDFNRMSDALFRKLDKIESKLDGKADKDEFKR